MGRPTIQNPDGSNHCTVTGVPSTYIGGKSYTVEVACTTFEGGTGCAHIFRMSAGTVNGGTCATEANRVQAATAYTWTAPGADSGDITIDALCGHYNVMVASAAQTSSFSDQAEATTTATTVTTVTATTTTLTTVITLTTVTTVTTTTVTYGVRGLCCVGILLRASEIVHCSALPHLLLAWRQDVYGLRVRGSG